MTDSLGERLAGADAVRAAREALHGEEGAWVVGGAIRDAVLGRPVVDVDLIVADDERRAARAIAAVAGGTAFELSSEFRTWRALAPDAGWHVDVTRMRGGGIEGDLALRDFTVNAIAVPLAELGPGLDPHGGLGDAADRVLRAVSERSFADDPLRVLRAARLAATLELTPEPGTVELARGEHERVAEPAGERQFAELRQIIAGPDPLHGLALLDELGATATVLPEFEALKGVEQNPNHHLDVHGHVLEVLARLLEVERDLDRYAGDRAAEVGELLEEPLADELTRRGALRFGALLHDLGKPATRDDSRGFVTFIGHDREGVDIVGRLCERLRVSRRLTSHLQGLTLHHLRLGFLAGEQPVPPRRIHEYLRATDPVAADVTLLSVADRLAARGTGPLASEEMVQAHLAVARTMLAAALDWRRDGPPRPPIRGDELAHELGLEPGPELGRLLAEIEAAAYAGEIAGRNDAVALARGLLSQRQ